MSKSNDKPKQDAEKPEHKKSEIDCFLWPFTAPYKLLKRFALLQAIVFVVVVLIVNVGILWIYKSQVDNFNAWSGLGFPVYNGAESVKTISIAVFAIFSLMAVLWRSIISASQVKELQEQGRRTEKQIKLSRKQLKETQVNNLTELFTKGVELINTPEPEKNSALVLAGVSILHQVALKQKGLFKSEVEDILVKNFLENTTLDESSPVYLWAALDVLDKVNSFYNTFYKFDKIFITFPLSSLLKEEKNSIKRIYNNLDNIAYKDCCFFEETIDNPNQYFDNCTFSYMNIVYIKIRSGANFIGGSIKGLDYIPDHIEVSFDEQNTYIYSYDMPVFFDSVNFTGCDKWTVGDATCVFKDCSYDPNNPPVDAMLRYKIDVSIAKAKRKRVKAAEANAKAKASVESEDITPTDDATTLTGTPTIDDKRG